MSNLSCAQNSAPDPARIESRFAEIIQECIALELDGAAYEAEVQHRVETEFPGMTVEWEPIQVVQ